MLLIGKALVMKCIVSYSQRELSISCLYNSKCHFNCSRLLARQSALILKVNMPYGSLMVALVMNASPVQQKKTKIHNAALAVSITGKSILPAIHYIHYVLVRQKHISFKIGCVVRLVKHLKGYWFS